MNLLVIGQGGREHALAWKLAQSPLTQQVWVAPGNAGTALEEKVSNIDIAATDIEQLITFAKQHHIELTIVGPEGPLAAGIVDAFQEQGLACFGPTQGASQLESSKQFCKDFLQQHHIPTAHYQCFTDMDAALDHLNDHPLPVVIKADGLAAGKGVIIAETLTEAREAVIDMLQHNRFGDAGARIVIEEFLDGEELSFIVMSDGQHCLPLASSQDHKRRDDGDIGPNTGGMGAYSPAPLLTVELEHTIMRTIIQPTIDGMAAQGHPYIGFLYAGLMISPSGKPKVLEYNCRLGDPETQPLLMRLQSDLIPLCQHALAGTLSQTHAQWDPRPAVTVVMAAGGYPNNVRKGDVINGIPTPTADIKVFHAGTSQQNLHTFTDGGRVLGITALGNTLKHAHQQAYATIRTIHWPNCFYRTDIGHRALAQTTKK